MIYWQLLRERRWLDKLQMYMSNTLETQAPAASLGLVARLAAHLGLTAPVEATPVAEADKLTADLAKLSGEYQALEAVTVELNCKIDTISAELAAVSAERDSVKAVVAAIEALVPNSTVSNADPAAAIAAAIAAKSVESISASGFPPDQAPSVNNEQQTEDTLSRDEFAKLTPEKQSAFSKRKGKITE